MQKLRTNAFGMAFGMAVAIMYAAVVLLSITVSKDMMIFIFNNFFYYGVDVEPIISVQISLATAIAGVMGSFAIGWISGSLIAGFYNLLSEK